MSKALKKLGLSMQENMLFRRMKIGLNLILAVKVNSTYLNLLTGGLFDTEQVTSLHQKYMKKFTKLRVEVGEVS